MVTEVFQANLRPELERSVTDLGYVTPTPIQNEVIPLMLEGHDVIGQAQTGTGKTAAFMLPIIQNLNKDDFGIKALILSPTRELAIQVAKAAEDYGKYLKIRVLAVYGGQPYYQQIRSLRQGVDIVVGTPGRILDLIQKEELFLNSIDTLVLDEADEMLSMGFIEDIEEILAACPEDRQTALFSATMPPRIAGLAKKYMQAPQHIAIKSKHLTIDSIDHRYYLVNQGEKLAVLTRIFEVEDITSGLIFVKTRIGTGELVNELVSRGFPAEALNGDLSQPIREQVLNRFRNNQIKVLVATDMAARGLDITDISHVFNYDLPDDPELYVHRTGRTGRAGASGIAITLVTPKETWQLHRIEGFTKQPITRMPIPTVEEIETRREEQLVDQMMVWLQRGRCQKELEIINRLAEMDFDPSQLAAAALKIARKEEKQRPIGKVTEIQTGRKKESGRANAARNRKSDRKSTGNGVEKGMVRVSINAGKLQGIRPADVVASVSHQADFPGKAIGAINIFEKHTLFDIPQQYADQVLNRVKRYKLRRNTVTAVPA
ncbi:MAG: DEAD/DEAH box helicase [Dehalococcoidales bacterium]|nr:DEAD/DEAH box helicase [Dehalococcoidales bacterium]